jgi:type III secretion protein T
MELEFQTASQLVTSIGVILPRIGGAFLLLPYFNGDTIPPMIRNVFLVSLALVLVPYSLQHPMPPMASVQLIPLLVKEVFIGVVIGFSFGIVFWAIEGVGQVIDTKVGSTTAQLSDPLTGHQTTLIGTFLSRLAGYLFAAFGGLRLFIDLVLTSFSVWPVTEPLPNLPAVGAMFFVHRFDDLMRITLLLSAPVLIALTLLEVGMGFINRYAPQLNVFSLSMSLKAWLAIFIVLLSLGNMSSFLLDWLGDQHGLLGMLPFTATPAAAN